MLNYICNLFLLNANLLLLNAKLFLLSAKGLPPVTKTGPLHSLKRF